MSACIDSVAIATYVNLDCLKRIFSLNLWHNRRESGNLLIATCSSRALSNKCQHAIVPIAKTSKVHGLYVMTQLQEIVSLSSVVISFSAQSFKH